MEDSKILKSGRQWHVSLRSVIYGILCVASLCAIVVFMMFDRPGSNASGRHSGHSSVALLREDHGKDTLVLYVFSNTDPEYITNLRFFAQFAISEKDRCDYVIIVQTDDNIPTPDLPSLPSNARYLFHTNECYDWGTIGWSINQAGVDTRPYSYFIFMNSSVRGPFIPPYAKNLSSWQDILIDRITDWVKLVGPTISCEGSPPGGRVTEKWRTNPHVQSYVLATDQVGLEIWKKDANVFQCWHSMWDVIWHGELGSSLAILNAGYSLDSLMLRYQGVDWRNKANWGCNAHANPYGEHYLDGISLNPYEVLFVKVKERVLQNNWSFANEAVNYARIMTDQADGRADPLANAYKANPMPFREERLGYLLQRGPNCFDEEYYRKENPDLAHLKTKEEQWSQFLRSGAFEGRSFRFTCPADLVLP